MPSTAINAIDRALVSKMQRLLSVGEKMLRIAAHPAIARTGQPNGANFRDFR